MARTLRQGLEEQNHTVTVAAEGAAALEAVTVANFDAVGLDAMLSAVDELAVTRRLRQ